MWKEREAGKESGVPENERIMRTLLQEVGVFRILVMARPLIHHWQHIETNVQSFDDHTHTHTQDPNKGG